MLTSYNKGSREPVKRAGRKRRTDWSIMLLLHNSDQRQESPPSSKL